MSFAYSHPSDNLAPSATSVTLSVGTPISGYGADKVRDGDPACPLKINGYAVYIDFVFSSPVLPQLVALIHTNIDGETHLIGDNTNLDAPAHDITFGVPTVSQQKWYSQPFLNLSTGGYTAKSKWRIKVVNNTEAPICIGEIFLGSTYRQFSADAGILLLQDTTFTRGARSLQHETNYGVKLSYQQAALQRTISGGCIVKGSDLMALEAWHEDARGRARSFLIVPDDVENDSRLVRFTDDALSYAALENGYRQVSVGFEELSRGMQWTEPA